jgi:hypothetical protein
VYDGWENETKKKDLDVEVNKTNNSSMAQNLDEIKRLGKELDQTKIGTELQEEENLTPDPKQ